MFRAHKIRIDCTREQHSLMMQTAGCARYAYNWGLKKWGKQYEAWKADSSLEKPNWVNISRQWTIEKPEWANKTARSAVTCSLSNLGTAFKNFSRRKAKYPKKHKRSQGISFQLGNATCSIEGNRIRLPIIDYVKLREQPRFQGKITGYTVQYIASHWYVTIAFDCPDVPKEASESVVGVDVGLQHPAIASDGTVLQLPLEKLQKLEVKKRRAQRALSRSKRNSTARERKRTKLQRIQQRITNIRQDAVHKFTTTVCKNHATVVTEDLNINELKAKAPARSVRRAYNSSLMGLILFQISYKAVHHIKAPKYFPSTKRCSTCGHVKEAMPPQIRTYHCDHCGAHLDRDENAARNLMLQPWVTR